MKVSVEYGDSLLEHDISELLTVGNLEDAEESDIIESIKEAIDINGDIDYLWDEIYDAVSNFDVLPQGEFDYEEDSQKLYQIAKQNLNEVKDKTDILITQYDDRNNPIKTRIISFFSILEDLLDCDYGDCAWDARLGQFVEERLMKFIKLSGWHWGLQTRSGNIIENTTQWPEPKYNGDSYIWGEENLQPIVWFGLDSETPYEKWILWHRGKSQIDGFWFNNEPWNIIGALVENVNDSFLIWYTAECGFETPDMDALLSDCPVKLQNEELRENVTVKMEDFFAEQWKKSKKVTEVVAALIWDGDKFMICQRPAHKARGMLWEFVGGKVEPGETKQQALIRECQEELAVTVSVKEEFVAVTHEYPDITVHLMLFHCTIAQGVPQMLEHNDIRWITVDEIPKYEFCPADVEIIKKVQRL